jgi:hypothetical protein
MRQSTAASRLLFLTVFGMIAAIAILTGLPARADARRSDVKVLHTYAVSSAWQVAHTIAVSTTNLLPLLPAGYQLVPASAIGLGSSAQGVVMVANVQGSRLSIDGRPSHNDDLLVVDVGILIAEPAEAALANANLPGALHFHTLAIYTDDPHYAASLRTSGMPVEFVKGIAFDRQFDDATGFGTLAVDVPARDAPFHSTNTGFGYQPVPGELHAVFWHRDRHGTSVLHSRQAILQGPALSQLYLRTGSRWGRLLLGGGIGPCPADPPSRSECVSTPSFSFRFPQGFHKRLSMISE